LPWPLTPTERLGRSHVSRIGQHTASAGSRCQRRLPTRVRPGCVAPHVSATLSRTGAALQICHISVQSGCRFGQSDLGTPQRRRARPSTTVCSWFSNATSSGVAPVRRRQEGQPGQGPGRQDRRWRSGCHVAHTAPGARKRFILTYPHATPEAPSYHPRPADYNPFLARITAWARRCLHWIEQRRGELTPQRGA
jgi:hypothetical protein